MNETKNKGFKRIFKAGIYSLQGIKAAFKNEAAFRQEVILAAVMIPLTFVLDVTQTHRMLMIASVLLVMIIELINTAVEAVVDRIGPENHELAGRAKDTGSAAVLFSLVLATYIWIEALLTAYF